METTDIKKKRGRIPKTPGELKRNHIGVYFTDAEIASLANRAGTHVPIKTEGGRSGGDTSARRKIADYIRRSTDGTLPPRIPEVNQKVWSELSPVLSNLNQIAMKLNTGKLIDDMDRIDIIEIQDVLTTLRPKLIKL